MKEDKMWLFEWSCECMLIKCNCIFLCIKILLKVIFILVRLIFFYIESLIKLKVSMIIWYIWIFFF